MEAIILFLATGLIGTIAFLWWLYDDKKQKSSQKHEH